MGNTSSHTIDTSASKKRFNNFYEVIDYIATDYILTLDFQSLSKVSENPDYCNELIILTSDIINKHFTELEVRYIAKRMQNGLDADELVAQKLMFLNKTELDEMNIQSDANRQTTKKMMCNGIAKFYIKIAHVYACIMKTVNPVYTYKDKYGATITKTLLEKDSIPKDTPVEISKLNICDDRINALQQGATHNQTATIRPKMCDMNLDSDGNLKSLVDEPGIPELMNLYNDDYDAETGEFKNMTESTKKQFADDVKLFYETFTGLEITPDIKQFSDIKLRKYKNRRGCQGDDGVYNTVTELPVSDTLYVQYANNLNTMINTAAENQSELLAVIDDLFVYSIGDRTKKIRVNPKLTEERLQKCVEKTRGLIIKLYMQCETDYVNGIKIYEAIVQKKIFDTTVNQIKSMQENIDDPVSSPKSIMDKSMLDKCMSTMSGQSMTNMPNMPEKSIPEKSIPEKSRFSVVADLEPTTTISNPAFSNQAITTPPNQQSKTPTIIPPGVLRV